MPGILVRRDTHTVVVRFFGLSRTLLILRLAAAAVHRSISNVVITSKTILPCDDPAPVCTIRFRLSGAR